MVQFRRSKKVGPFRLTVSKRGVGVSAGAGPVRISRSATGRVSRTYRVPGTGIYDTKTIGKTRNRSSPSRQHAAAPALTASTGRQRAPAPAHPATTLSPDQWAFVLQPDETPAALPFQRAYVRGALGHATGSRLPLHGLTLGQAQRLLQVLGRDAAPLFRSGRDSVAWNRAGLITLWVVAVLATVLSLAIPVIGPVIFVTAVSFAVYYGIRWFQHRHDSTFTRPQDGA
ncbi:DUF4236 domain-containing protein [Rhodococcus ruber]